MDNVRCPRGINEPPVLSKIAWTTTPANYDVVANSPGGQAAPVSGGCCKQVSAGVAGTVNYTSWDGTSGAVYVSPGGVYPCPAKALLSTSTATNVTVFW